MGAGGRDGGREPSPLQLHHEAAVGGAWLISSCPHSVPASGSLRKNSLFSFSIQDPERGTCHWGGAAERGGPRFLSFFLAWAARWPQISAGSWRQGWRSLPGRVGEGAVCPKLCACRGWEPRGRGAAWNCPARPPCDTPSGAWALELHRCHFTSERTEILWALLFCPRPTPTATLPRPCSYP